MDTKRATPKYYKDAPPNLYAKLLEFRKEHHIKRFEFNGKTVEYIAAGKGEKTLLMFHGAFGSADRWDASWSEGGPLAPLLPNRFLSAIIK